MRARNTTILAGLLIGSALAAAPAFAQTSYPAGRAANDGGMVGEPNQKQPATPAYNSQGQVVPAPAANEATGRPVTRRGAHSSSRTGE
jgi:hypothetical protein